MRIEWVEGIQIGGWIFNSLCY